MILWKHDNKNKQPFYEYTTVVVKAENYSTARVLLIDKEHYISMNGKFPVINKRTNDPSAWCVMATDEHNWYILRGVT